MTLATIIALRDAEIKRFGDFEIPVPRARRFGEYRAPEIARRGYHDDQSSLRVATE